jgi:magnesium transporter
VLDKVVDDYSPVLDGLQDDIDEIEVQTFGGDPKVSRRIYQLTREVIEFQRAVEPLSEVFKQLRFKLKEHADDSGTVDKQRNPHLELRRNLRDVIDNATRVFERTSAYRELLTNILQVNAALVGQRQNEEMARMTEAGFNQNEQMKKVSSWAAIFFAPSLVAGVYGMNFDHMPELHWAWGYPFAFLLMALFALVLYTVFKKRGWL